MRRITVADEQLLEASPCTEAEIDVFTTGDCWKLARELHLREVGRLVTVSSAEDSAEWCHMGVELPDGLILDVRGIQEPQAMVERWGHWFERAALFSFDPTDEVLWDELIGDQNSIHESTAADVDRVADRLMDWLEEL